METWLLIIIFVLGLCFGSFVNMLVFRKAIKYKLENKKLKVKNNQRSFCDYCGRQLKWGENIPVMSWIIQKGKTKCCGKKLSLLYPIVEIAMGLLFLIFSLQFISNLLNGQTLGQLSNFQLIIQFLVGLIIIVFLVFSGVFDFKYMILPDFSTIILIISAITLWLICYFGQWNYLLSSFLSFVFLGFLYLVTQKRGMGFGDVKLAIFMGLFLGYPKIIVSFYIAFVTGALVSLILLILKKATKKTQIPFGPFLILGVFIAWFLGDSIWKLIFSI